MVRLTDRPDMPSDVYRGRKTTKQQQQQKKNKQKKKTIIRGGCGGRGSMCVWHGENVLQLHSEILHCLRTVI